MEFGKIGESFFDVVESKRPFRMASDFDSVPGAEIGKNLALGFLEFFFNYSNFFFEADVQRVGFGMFFQLFELGLQFGNRLLEIELVFHWRLNLANWGPEAIGKREEGWAGQ